MLIFTFFQEPSWWMIDALWPPLCLGECVVTSGGQTIWLCPGFIFRDIKSFFPNSCYNPEATSGGPDTQEMQEQPNLCGFPFRGNSEPSHSLIGGLLWCSLSREPECTRDGDDSLNYLCEIQEKTARGENSIAISSDPSCGQHLSP